MATIDTSIYGQVARPSRIQTPFESQNQLSAVLQGVNQNRMTEMKMQQAQKDQDKQNRLSSLLAAEYAAPEQRESALLRGGFFDESQKLGKSRLEGAQTQASTQKTLADTEKQKLATSIEKIGAVGQLLGGVRDQGTYDQARAQAQAMGLDVSSMPPQFDPALVEQKRAQSLNMEQQLAQVWKQKGFDLDVQKFGETKRSNIAGEGLQRRGQDITARGQNLTDARARERLSFDQGNAVTADGGPNQAPLVKRYGKPSPGYRWKPDGTQEFIPGGPADNKAGKEGSQRVTDAKDVLGMLADAEKLLPASTGSYAGVAIDEAARAFGGSTPGAQAAAELKALQGALVSKMPKMSGPQSDKDVLLYREMAGQIGDPTIPAATKQAAIKTIRKLNERYAGLPDSSAAAPNIDALLEKYK